MSVIITHIGNGTGCSEWSSNPNGAIVSFGKMHRPTVANSNNLKTRTVRVRRELGGCRSDAEPQSLPRW